MIMKFRGLVIILLSTGLLLGCSDHEGHKNGSFSLDYYHPEKGFRFALHVRSNKEGMVARMIYNCSTATKEDYLQAFNQILNDNGITIENGFNNVEYINVTWETAEEADCIPYKNDKEQIQFFEMLSKMINVQKFRLNLTDY